MTSPCCLKNCMTPRIVSPYNMIMSPAAFGTKNDCAGEDQQEFTRPMNFLSICSPQIYSFYMLSLSKESTVLVLSRTSYFYSYSY
jgi:hypothetical protein